MKDYFLFLLRVIVGILFIASGSSKVINLSEFSFSLSTIIYLDGAIVSILSVLISIIELIAGLFLLLGFSTKLSSTIVLVLLVLFIAAVLPHIIIGNSINCGCFDGFVKRKVDISLLLQNIALLFATMAIYLSDRRYLALDNIISKHLN